MECMRLQTVPDHYFDDAGISNTQIYKLLGNGWTVDIICHIFEGIKAEFIQKQDEKVA
jgi:DNA (cytosine-5)-methyltransferase 3A